MNVANSSFSENLANSYGGAINFENTVNGAANSTIINSTFDGNGSDAGGGLYLAITPDHNFAGYEFWLTKLNQFTLPGEDARDEAVALVRVRRAEMVRAFIESAEYHQRFGGAPSGDQEATKLGAAKHD